MTSTARTYALALGAVLAVSITFAASPLQHWLEDSLGLAWLFHWRGPVEPPDQVVIVAINGATASALGLPRQTYRWPRTVHARLLDALRERGAAVVVLDIAMREPKTQEEDNVLAGALRQSGNVVLFKYLRRETKPVSSTSLVMDSETEMPPIPLLAEAGAAVAPFTLPLAPARVVHAALFHQGFEGAEATMPLMALQLYRRSSRAAWLQEMARRAPALAEQLQHSDSEQAFARVLHAAAQAASGSADPTLRTYVLDAIPINFYGPPRTLTTIPYHALLLPDAKEAVPDLAGRVVFVGYSETVQTEQVDTHPTVFTDVHGSNLAGVEIGATMFANLLEDRVLWRPACVWLIAGVALWTALLFGIAASLSLLLALIGQGLMVGGGGVARAQAV